ncbi:MAG: hypothetical protein JSV91_05480 [Phycisphaerales bacterium]|nr:MAG: hypothetical protein JSV91_05480 [Phycisphaerales bacterium]
MSQISTYNSINGAAQRTNTSQFSEMTSEDFIKIMFTELTNQDPFEPNDSQALLDQINTIRSIESDMALSDQLETMVTENQLASASNLIGKFVGGLSDDAGRVAGYVVSVIRQGNEVAVELDTGWVIPAENIETIIDPSLFEDPGTGEPEPGEGEDG